MPDIESQFKSILSEIQQQDWDQTTWAEHEAGDWFQTDNFCGGFEADETYKTGEFNFSYHDPSGKEWWFTFTLKQVPGLVNDGFKSIKLTDPECFDMDSV